MRNFVLVLIIDPDLSLVVADQEKVFFFLRSKVQERSEVGRQVRKGRDGFKKRERGRKGRGKTKGTNK